MEHLIREIRENEVEIPVDLCQKHAEYEKTDYNPTLKAQRLRSALFSSRKPLYCYVIESDDRVVGYFSYTFDFSTWDVAHFLHLDCLYFMPEYRGMGIGKAVFGFLKDVAEENSCVNIQWQTPVFNEIAIRFYNKTGAVGKEKIRFVMQTSF